MNILITHPYYWPYVRRGAERFIHGLSSRLCQQGHRVNIVTTIPGPRGKRRQDEVGVIYHPSQAHPLLKNPFLLRHGLTPELLMIPKFLQSLRTEPSDVVHAFHFLDGFSAHLYSRCHRSKYILSFTGLPIARYFRQRRIPDYLLRKSFESAYRVIVYSNAAARHLREGYGIEGIAIPGALDVSHFHMNRSKDLDAPRILFSGSLLDPAKNPILLVRAFERFKREVPRAVLQFSGQVDGPTASWLLREVSPPNRASVMILGPGKLTDLPGLYADAAMTVLPSVGEALGIALIESLASGTPVVGTDDGGIPEIISDPGIGVLFRQDRPGAPPNNPDDLCSAMLRCLEISRKPETRERCRSKAMQFDWSVVLPRIESIYREVAGE